MSAAEGINKLLHFSVPCASRRDISRTIQLCWKNSNPKRVSLSICSTWVRSVDDSNSNRMWKVAHEIHPVFTQVPSLVVLIPQPWIPPLRSPVFATPKVKPILRGIYGMDIRPQQEVFTVKGCDSTAQWACCYLKSKSIPGHQASEFLQWNLHSPCWKLKTPTVPLYPLALLGQLFTFQTKWLRIDCVIPHLVYFGPKDDKGILFVAVCDDVNSPMFFQFTDMSSVVTASLCRVWCIWSESCGHCTGPHHSVARCLWDPIRRHMPAFQRAIQFWW